MNPFVRGVRNAFRNSIRTISVVAILATGVGLALIMLMAMFAVQERIDEVRASVGNTLTVSPAGIRGFQGGGELLSTDDAGKVAALDHVTGIEQSFEMRLTTDTDTNLLSAIEPGSFGNRNNSSSSSGNQNSQAPPGAIAGQSGQSGSTQRPFTLPVMAHGVTNAYSLQSLGIDKLNLTSGEAFENSSTENVAVVGAALATKNNLTAGSTFKVYGVDVKVIGIYDAENQFTNSGLIMPIETLRNLSDSTGQINSMVVTVDMSDNVETVKSAVKEALGSKADVVSQLDSSTSALSSLEGVKSIAGYSLLGSLVSASTILFLIMLMVVRERRQEIGVLKAIGASNFKIVKQFIAESLTFTALGSALGLVLGVACSNPVLRMLVNSSSTAASQNGPMGGPGGTGRLTAAASQQEVLKNITTVIDVKLLAFGFLAALIIAVLGSAVPAWVISKVRPAEAMRGE